MGGDIRVDSTLGKGTRVVFRIPLVVPPDAEPDDARIAKTSPDMASQPLAGLSILAVDDEPINRLVLEEILGAAGARVTLAASGQEAVDLVERNGPAAYHAVLMDLQMPGLGGYEATEIIRGLAPMLPVIAQTAHAFASERERCEQAGMKAHLTKPFDPEVLIRTVHQFSTTPAAVTTAPEYGVGQPD